jgi:hypothetical protein
MVKKLLILFLFISNIGYSQTNYMTIMNPLNRDSVIKVVDLHLIRAKRLDRVSNCMHLVAAVSMISLHYLKNDGKTNIWVPASVGIASFIPQYFSWVEEEKAEDLKLLFGLDYKVDGDESLDK